MNAELWRRVRNVLDEVLQRPPSEWAMRIANACGDDAELQREVETILTSSEHAKTFLETPLASLLGARTTDLTGQQIQSYRIEARLGAGGMGEIYRARDTKLDRPVALKLLTSTVVHDPERLRRFRSEARAASSLNHPHILVIHDVGEFDGRPFIVTELVEGSTLRQRLERGPVTVRDVMQIGTQVASALAAAHAGGIVHRDIKPDNVMLRPDGYVKVLDFGLAKLTAPESGPGAGDESVIHTESGVIMGTPQYMSPEQARGGAVDFRSDQFSLGVVLYELVTGRSPFTRGSLVETAAAVIHDTPEPLDRACPDLPQPLRWTIERCLSKEPGDRYASTAELHRDLATVQERISDIRPQPAALAESNVPPAPGVLVGRDAEVAAIRELLASGDVRWITLTGPGGVGKTRLLLHLAREARDRFGGAVYFVPLAGITDPKLVPSAIAEVLAARPTASESTLTALKRHLRSVAVPMLLVLDNFEHVSLAAVAVAELLDSASDVKVMVSSRASLHLSTEHEYHVAPLAVPDRRQRPQPDAIAASAAVALFVERARAVRPDFAVTAENAAAVADICVTLDGLPLAIELAAARVKLLPPQALLARLSGRRLSLDGGARDLPLRQQALRNTMDWGYDLLTPAEQRLFRRLAVFVGTWTIEATEAVCNARDDLELDVFDGLASLVDKSLIRPVEAGGADARFTMLETIREYGVERLAAAGEAAATRKAHAAYCLVLAEEGGSSEGTVGVQWLALCDVEHGNLRAALDYLIESREVEWALRLGSALLPFWQARALLAEGRDRLARAIKLADSRDASPAKARATIALGTLLYTMGNAAAAESLQTAALADYRQLGDRRGIAVALNAIGVCQEETQQPEAARANFEEALSIWRELGHDAAAARTLVNLAAIALDAGAVGAAVDLYRQARSTCELIRDVAGAAWSINLEAQAELRRGNTPAAEALYADALDRFRSIDDAWGTGDTLIALGELACERGAPDAGYALFREAQDAFVTAGDIRGTVRLIEAIARQSARGGAARRALTLAGAATALRQSIGLQLPRPQREAFERELDAVRQQADKHAAASAWMEGWTLSADEAVRLALSSE